MLSLQEFQITDPSSNYSLCEVTVTDSGIIKQRRLPDQLQNLAERIGVASRYYLKNNQSTETLVPDELAGELMRESQVQFLHLNAVEVAVQLTLQDFAIFTQIESTEYVDDLFQLRSKYGTPHLSQFSEVYGIDPLLLYAQRNWFFFFHISLTVGESRNVLGRDGSLRGAQSDAADACHQTVHQSGPPM